MHVLIIGFGSIGRRHFEVLSGFLSSSLIHIVSKQDIAGVESFKELEDIEHLDLYDYFIISSETVKHYEHLHYIATRVKQKKILVEKPLYDRKHEVFQTDNDVFTAYNLRFHPILRKLKEILQDQKIYFANVVCGQYLPAWRPDQDYRLSYSADRKRGGGVLRDLSHELDYIHWLFGHIEQIEYINTKISDLDIESDDIFTAIAITAHQTIVNVTIDYISKSPIRRLIIHTQESTIEADMIKSSLLLFGKDGICKSIETPKIDRNYTYMKMHQSILNNDMDSIATFQEGVAIVKLIDSIEYKE